jgi:hypothetical protein
MHGRLLNILRYTDIDRNTYSLMLPDHCSPTLFILLVCQLLAFASLEELLLFRIAVALVVHLLVMRVVRWLKRRVFAV